ncbi:hypothetical protein BH11CYA1_BH11CYA1_46100 [soil metagenome]
MCVSLHPARFSDTVVGIFEGPNGRRYLAYQNVAANLAKLANPPAKTVVAKAVVEKPVRRGSRGICRKPTEGKSSWNFESAVTPAPTAPSVVPAPTISSGNAMILPIPDDVANIEVIDTTTCPAFLKDIRSALTPRSRGGMLGADSVRRGSKSIEVRIINFDVYTIVIAKNAAAMRKALASDAVPADRRPALNADMIKAYTKWYPGWAIAVCCFNNADAKEAKPLLFSYEPSKQANPDDFFVPTLDAHDGKVPDLSARVDVDHTVFVATNDMAANRATTVYYHDSDVAPGVAQLLPKAVIGKVLRGTMGNGDIIFRRSDLAAGKFNGLRALPPGAAQAADGAEFI